MATRLLPGSKQTTYEESLGVLKITSLETRRKRGDLIQFYKVLNGIDQIEWKNERLITIQGEQNGPVASNLKKKGLSFHRENARTSFLRVNFF